jgi:hypothetical protein
VILAGVSGADAALIADLVDRYGIAFDTSDHGRSALPHRGTPA